MPKNTRIILALDEVPGSKLWNLLDQLDPAQCIIKVGPSLYSTLYKNLLGQLERKGFDILLDFKWHDIPNTVANACRQAVDSGVWGVTLHTLGGRKMLEAAVTACGETSMRLFGVTVLTHHDAYSLHEVGMIGIPVHPDSCKAMTGKLAGLALSVGLDGIVCSGQELPMLTDRYGSLLEYVVPGIREVQGLDDQTRTITASEATRLGADYIVVGRPILQAEDPVKALNQSAAASIYNLSA